jgi:hypothetical protein
MQAAGTIGLPITWYDKSMQRRFKARLSEFEHATIAAGHGWRQLDLAPSFGRWIATHELFQPLLRQPTEMRGLRPEFEDQLARLVEEQLNACASTEVLAVDGCGALFGIARISTLVSRVAAAIRGRMLIGFPGKYSAGVYRLLDARDGWNYHAVPIPPDSPQ